MMSPTVVRRFDLRANQDKALNDVSDQLRQLVGGKGWRPSLRSNGSEALSLLEVRLQGDSSAISRVTAEVADGPTCASSMMRSRVAPPAEPKHDAISVGACGAEARRSDPREP